MEKIDTKEVQYVITKDVLGGMLAAMERDFLRVNDWLEDQLIAVIKSHLLLHKKYDELLQKANTTLTECEIERLTNEEIVEEAFRIFGR